MEQSLIHWANPRTATGSRVVFRKTQEKEGNRGLSCFRYYCAQIWKVCYLQLEANQCRVKPQMMGKAAVDFVEGQGAKNAQSYFFFFSLYQQLSAGNKHPWELFLTRAFIRLGHSAPPFRKWRYYNDKETIPASRLILIQEACE